MLGIKTERFLYDYESERELELVEVGKIAGGFRFDDPDASVLDLATAQSNANLNRFRMARATGYIKRKTLAELHGWYSSECTPIDLVYYSNDDQYLVSNDGTHRSLYAKIVGAPVIRANVYRASINSKRQQLFMRLQEIMDRYHIVALNTEVSEAKAYGITSFKMNEDIFDIGFYYNIPESKSLFTADRIDRLEKELIFDFAFMGNRFFRLLTSLPVTRIRLLNWVEQRKEISTRYRLEDWLKAGNGKFPRGDY